MADIINEKFDTTFSLDQIKYRVSKLLEETKGKAHEDAHDFVKLCQLDAHINGSYFEYEANSQGEFDKCVYLSKTMLTFAQYFLDIIIVDSTYRRNRFNLILVNVIGINNYGQSVILAFGLVSGETKETYHWFFANLKKAWKQLAPLNCISDECESIQYGKSFLV